MSEEEIYEDLKADADAIRSAKVYETLITFLLQSKELLYDTAFLKSALRRIRNAYQYKELWPLCNQVLEKMSMIEKEVKSIIPKNTKFLGKGSYGCVVKPALPNRIDHQWKMYPDDVSKLFRDEIDAKEAVDKAAFWVSATGNAGQAMHKQHRVYRSNELPEKVKATCELPDEENLYVARMPNLGVSLNNVESILESVRSIPFPIILQQIGKLFSQVGIMHEKDYVHGDIRTPNIMIDPTSGTMTLIDFDWFYQKDEFFEQYSEAFGTYYNPPESLLKANIEDALRKRIPLYANENVETMKLYVRHTQNMYERIGIPFTANIVHEANINNIQLFSGIVHMGQYYEILFETFDSYSLSLVILDFLTFVYPYKKPLKDILLNGTTPYTEKEIYGIERTVQQLYNILFQAISLKIIDRLSLQDILLNMDALIRGFSSAASGGKTRKKRSHAKTTRRR
jgi:serine/threonine protein kinase